MQSCQLSWPVFSDNLKGGKVGVRGWMRKTIVFGSGDRTHVVCFTGCFTEKKYREMYPLVPLPYAKESLFCIMVSLLFVSNFTLPLDSFPRLLYESAV